MTGARVTLNVYRGVSSEMWERSTSIPSLTGLVRMKILLNNEMSSYQMYLFEGSMVKRREWLEYAARIGEGVTTGVSVCHIPNAKGVVLSEEGERIAELVTADRGKSMSFQIYRLRRAELGMYPSTPSHLATFPDSMISLASSAAETM